jgi:hypothetical protein
MGLVSNMCSHPPGRDGGRSQVAEGGRPLEAVEAELTELCGHLTAGTARFLALVAEFDSRKGWADQGCKDCAEWLSWRCSIAPVTAREQVRVAARLQQFAEVRAAFEVGELSYSKVRAICRVVTEATEHDLVQIARHATAADLEAMCRSYRAARECEEETEERYHVTCFQDHDGTWILRGRLRAEDGALVRKALDAGADRIHKETRDSAESPSWGDRTGQAMIEMAAGALERGPTKGSNGDRYLVIMHTEENGAAELEGAEVDPHTGELVCCDTSVVELIHRGTGPPDVERRTRVIPPSLRRALVARDRHCSFPGCNLRRFTDGHHLVHWPKGGPTNLENLTLLCRFHHRLVHGGGFSVYRRGDGELEFRRPDGTVIDQVARPCLPDGPDLITGHDDLGLTIDDHTCAPLSGGELMDRDLAVHALLSTERFFRRQ